MDLTRQVLSKLANQVFLDAVTAFKRKDLKALNLHSKKFIQLIKDIDILLTSYDNFLLGTWLKSANKLAKNIFQPSPVLRQSDKVLKNFQHMSFSHTAGLHFSTRLARKIKSSTPTKNKKNPDFSLPVFSFYFSLLTY